MKSWRDNSHFLDCIQNGRIPDQIPDHYLKWAHGMAGLKENAPPKKYNPIPPKIMLGHAK